MAFLIVGLAASLGMTTAAGVLILVGVVAVLPRMVVRDLYRFATAKRQSGKEGSGPFEPLP